MAEWTRKTLWRQGSLLTDDAIKKLSLLHPVEPPNTEVIMATHDCDLAQAPEVEGSVEVIVGRRISVANGNNTHAQNSRTLHIPFIGTSSFWAEFNASAKICVSKSALVEYSPQNESCLAPSSVATFQRWLSSRYRRSAFPTESGTRTDAYMSYNYSKRIFNEYKFFSPPRRNVDRKRQ
jgi:hypothetical protein